jgi:glutamine synthetase
MGHGLTMVATSDLSGLLRGKGFNAADLDRRLARGVGWTPTNVQITCFDTIADSPFGALGDLLLIPDPETRVRSAIPDGSTLDFLLGDIRTLEGEPWECCTRSLLRAALEQLRKASGLELRATFEHEFMLPGGRGTRAFSLEGFHERGRFLEALFVALEGAEIVPDSALREYGPDQMEVTLPPKPALKAADEAAILREITRITARAMGLSATFTPLLAPTLVGNGVHIHMSLWTPDGRPATYDPDGTAGLSATAGAFVAGILARLNALSALTAPSAISFLRLTPHRWSAAYNNLGAQDREAAVRICPVSARDLEGRRRQFNFEFRATDAAASPHLALAALVIAGTMGIEAGLAAPAPTAEDLSLLAPEALAERDLRRLPGSIDEALIALEADSAFRSRLPKAFPAVYGAHKRGELAHVAPMTEAERFAAYAAVY